MKSKRRWFVAYPWDTCGHQHKSLTAARRCRRKGPLCYLGRIRQVRGGGK